MMIITHALALAIGAALGRKYPAILEMLASRIRALRR